MFGSNKNALPSTSVEAVKKRLADGDKPFILDVREPSEFETGHIEGATLIPLGTLANRLTELPKDRPIVAVCRSGNRSLYATSFLVEHGYTNVENMIGGMTAWGK